MKKKFLKIAVLLICTTFLSCSSDDNESSIVAKWNYSQQGSLISGQEVVQDYVNGTGCEKDNVQFFSNGIAKLTRHYENCQDDGMTGTYTKEGNTLIVNFGQGGVTFGIKTLSESKLKLYRTTDSEGSSVTSITVFTKD